MPEILPTWELEEEAILHREPTLLALCKPAGLPTQATRDPRRDHLIAAVSRYLEREGFAGRPMLHHRLDAQTSGVLILALAPEANAGLARAFRERFAQKTYRALTALPPDSRALPPEVDNHLRKVRERGRQRMVAVRAGGDRARTSLRLLGTGPRALEVEAQPHTGRMHQIRVHLADLGAPILGDPLYGEAALRRAPQVSRLMLHAERLVLPHPLGSGVLDLQAPVPQDYRQARSRWIPAGDAPAEAED